METGKIDELDKHINTLFMDIRSFDILINDPNSFKILAKKIVKLFLLLHK